MHLQGGLSPADRCSPTAWVPSASYRVGSAAEVPSGASQVGGREGFCCPFLFKCPTRMLGATPTWQGASVVPKQKWSVQHGRLEMCWFACVLWSAAVMTFSDFYGWMCSAFLAWSRKSNRVSDLDHGEQTTSKNTQSLIIRELLISRFLLEQCGARSSVRWKQPWGRTVIEKDN